MARAEDEDANDPFARPTSAGPVSDALREYRPQATPPGVPRAAPPPPPLAPGSGGTAPLAPPPAPFSPAPAPHQPAPHQPAPHQPAPHQPVPPPVAPHTVNPRQPAGHAPAPQVQAPQPYVGRPGDAPAFPPGYGGRAEWTKAPLGIGEGALWATGIATLGAVFAALAAPGYVNGIRLTGQVSDFGTIYGTFVSLTQLAMLVGWILLALWMYKASVYRRVQGVSQTMPPLMSWFGWIIPLAALVLPAVSMRDTQRTGAQPPGAGNLWLWWGGWLTANALFLYGSNVSDPLTGELNQVVVDTLVGIAAVNAIVLLGSWWGLRGLIQDFAASVRTPQ